MRGPFSARDKMEFEVEMVLDDGEDDGQDDEHGRAAEAELNGYVDATLDAPRPLEAAAALENLADLLEREEGLFMEFAEDPDLENRQEYTIGRLVMAVTDHPRQFFDSLCLSYFGHDNAHVARAAMRVLACVTRVVDPQMIEEPSNVDKVIGWIRSSNDLVLRSAATMFLALSCSDRTVSDAAVLGQVGPVLLLRLRRYLRFLWGHDVTTAHMTPAQAHDEAHALRCFLAHCHLLVDLDPPCAANSMQPPPPLDDPGDMPLPSLMAGWRGAVREYADSAVVGLMVGEARAILEALTMLGDYSEVLGPVLEYGGMDMVLAFLAGLQDEQHSDRQFVKEALHLVASLLPHKKFAADFVDAHGIQRLLRIQRVAFLANDVAVCFYNLSGSVAVMEKVCLLPDETQRGLMGLVQWLVGEGTASAQRHGCMFLASVFAFPAMVDLFDASGGLAWLVAALAALHPGHDTPASERQIVMHALGAIRQYLRLHLARLAYQVRRSRARTHASEPAPAYMPAYKAAPMDPPAVQANLDLISGVAVRSLGRWPPLQAFLGHGLVGTCLALVLSSEGWRLPEVAEVALACLQVVSLFPPAQLPIATTPANNDPHSMSPEPPHNPRPLNRVHSAGADGEEEGDEAEGPEGEEGEGEPMHGRGDRPGENGQGENHYRPGAAEAGGLGSGEYRMNGMQLLLDCAEGRGHSAPEVRKAALSVICNCVYRTPAGPGQPRRAGPTRSGDVSLEVHNVVRNSNGIRVLLSLLHERTPLVHADAIRALACKALLGLSQNHHVKQILGKLQVSSQLSELMREPVVADNGGQHALFRSHGAELIARLTGKAVGTVAVETADHLLTMLERSDIVAQTQVAYPARELLVLIQQHLASQGLARTAQLLAEEAHLPPDLLKGPVHQPGPLVASTPLVPRAPPPPTPRILSVGNPPHTPRQPPAPSATRPATSAFTTPQRPALPPPPPPPRDPAPMAIATTPQPPRTRPGNPPAVLANGTPFLTPQPIKTTHRMPPEAPAPPPPIPPATPAPAHGYALQPRPERVVQQPPGTQTRELAPGRTPPGAVTLDRIVTQYLRDQHAHCPNPVAVLPPLSLLTPHSCPLPVLSASAHPNLARRVFDGQCGLGYGGLGGRAAYRKMLHSRFRPTRTYRKEATTMTCVAFLGQRGEQLVAGTHLGELLLFDVRTSTLTEAWQCHEGYIWSVRPTKAGTHMLTSSPAPSESPSSALWRLSNMHEPLVRFEDDIVLWSNVRERQVIGTSGTTVRIYSADTFRLTTTLVDPSPAPAGDEERNCACFNPTDELVLSDGVLWDPRMKLKIHKFDKFNSAANGAFHPNGLEIIINSEVWDMRSFKLLRTCPALDQAQVTFTNQQDVLYGVIRNYDEEQRQARNQFGSSFRTHSALDYSPIATVDLERSIIDLALAPSDDHIAVCECPMTDGLPGADGMCRLYEVGRRMPTDDDSDPDVGSGVEDDEDDDNDSDDDHVDSETWSDSESIGDMPFEIMA